MKKRKLLYALLGVTFCIAGVSVQAVATPFEDDVTQSINDGLAWQKAANAYTGGAGEATGLSVLALLEKRASGNPADPPQGYDGATAAEQADLRSAVAYMSNIVNGNINPFHSSYRNGNFLMAMALYLRTGGPNNVGAAIPADVAIDRMVDHLLSYQRASGYWPYYSFNNADDSSTTQFAVAGLTSAKALYLDPAWIDRYRALQCPGCLCHPRHNRIYCMEYGF